jgi:amino acid transporter/mannitol/fructose-specific phosphotransferase system IIA component (Ntr-type)
VFSVATGATLSAGLFLLPGLAAQMAGPAIVLCYLLAVIPLIPAAISIVELSTAMPRAGGAYYFLDRSLGPVAGTVGGLGTWLALTLKTAFALVGMGAYITVLVPDAPAWLMTMVAAAFALVFGAVNWMGAHRSGVFQIAMVAGLLAILAWFVGYGAVSVDFSHFAGFFSAGANSIAATTGLVYISYVGVTKVASISEEVRDPEKNLPRGIFLSLGTVVLVYGLCTFVMVGALPASELSGNLTPMATTALRIGGRLGELVIVGAALIAFASVGNAGILSASRYPLAMGRDQLVPQVFRHLSPRGVPTIGILVTVGTILFFLLVLDPLRIAKLASTFQLLMFGLLCFAVIVMRESRIESYDPGFRSPFYPWTQIAGMVIPIVLIGEMGWLPVLFSVGLIALGISWYVWYARHNVVRHGAIYHVFERLGRQRFDELDVELRGILKEKGLRDSDGFDEVVARAGVLDFNGQTDYDEIVRQASDKLARRLPVPSQVLVDGFTEGTRIGVTPVTRGIALPHLRLGGIDRPEMVLVRSKGGLHIPVGMDADASAVEETHALFFLVSPDDDPGRHLRFLANLASQVDDPGFMTRWLAAGGRDELRRMFLAGDRHLSVDVGHGAAAKELADKAVSELRLPEGTLIALVRRRGETIVPRGSTRLRKGDRLTIIGGVEEIDELRSRFSTT